MLACFEQVAGLPTLPPSLLALLTDKKLLKYGVAVTADATRVRKDWGAGFLGEMELFPFCRDRAIVPPNRKSMGLAELYALVAGKHLDKPRQIQCIDWSAELSEEQVKYAGLDAYACLDIYARVKSRKAFGLSLNKTDYQPGDLVLYRYPTGCLPKYWGVVLEDPVFGSTIEVDCPLAEAEGMRGKMKMKVVRGQCLVSVERIDNARGSECHYPQDFNLSLIKDLVPPESPFVMLLNKSYVFTRPPLEDPTKLPPPDAAGLLPLDELSLQTTDTDAIQADMADAAREMMEEEEDPRVEAESQVASGGMAGPGDEESELGLVATRGEDESDSENGASFVVRTGLQDQRKDALLQSLRHLKADCCNLAHLQQLDPLGTAQHVG